MKKVFILFLIFTTYSICQKEESHIWKPLITSSGEKFWYDPTTFDSVSNDVISVWILESHRPPLKFEGIDSEVYRSKILYRINLASARYGLKKICYYGLTNKEVYSYDYEQFGTNELFSFPYPIIVDSKIYLVLQEFLKKHKLKN